MKIAANNVSKSVKQKPIIDGQLILEHFQIKIPSWSQLSRLLSEDL
jgi:hypothetical protein